MSSKMKLLQPVDYSKRVYGLDLYRAIAILMVVHGHGRFMLKGTYFESFPWIKLVDGVELFFVLSGFLIGSILLKLLEQSRYKLTPRLILSFWKRRWYRTLPNYYLILLANVLLVYFGIIHGDIQQFNVKFLLFLQNFSQPFYDFFWESWSLSIEEWFYIFLPITFALVLKIWPNRKGVFAAIALLIVAPLLYRLSISGQTIDWFWWDVKFRKVVLVRLDTIIYGVLAAAVKFYYPSSWKRMAQPALWLGLVIIFTVIYLPRDPNALFFQVFFFNLTTIGAMLLLPFFDSLSSFRSKVGKAVTHISLISYSMYLVNLALVAQVVQKQFPVQNPLDGTIKYVLYWVVVLVVSTLLYRFFEKPMMDLRDRK